MLILQAMPHSLVEGVEGAGTVILAAEGVRGVAHAGMGAGEGAGTPPERLWLPSAVVRGRENLMMQSCGCLGG